MRGDWWPVKAYIAAAACAACGSATGLEPSLLHDVPGTMDAFPTRNGVPIGDCTGPDTAELEAKGCPSTEPKELSGCDVVGTDCRYIHTEDRRSSRRDIICIGVGPQWGMRAEESCGESCDMDGANTIELDASTCANRDPVACDDFGGASSLIVPSGYTLSSLELQTTVESCNADILGNHVQLVFSGGCPRRITSEQALAPSAVACLRAALGNVRWDCARMVPCVTVATVVVDP
jgi:hypothetical protein